MNDHITSGISGVSTVLRMITILRDQVEVARCQYLVFVLYHHYCFTYF